MTAARLKPVTKTPGAPRVETPAAPVHLPEAGQMLNVVLAMLLLILLCSVVWHFL